MNQAEVKRIVAELLPYIRYHRLQPGDRLPSERDLCTKFNASRNSVREALTALEIMRVVERRPNSGIYLQELSRDTSVDAMVMFQDAGVPLLSEEVAGFVETRRILEIESFRLACERSTEEDLQKLREILTFCEENIENCELIAEYDAIFHLALVEAAHNQVYLRVVNSFYLTSKDRRKVFFKSLEQCKRSHQDHLKLYNSLKDRDYVSGKKILNRHLATVGEFWERHLKQEKESAAREEKLGKSKIEATR
ncbi:FadR family transcriptional regulator [Sneathiella marina]|uniref:FadR family transcriptional regulator n=1 Tax=Sneathiella marina TaxID=2950108 RepID=A0ABY4W4L6_9PROT|nr:FadR/GntR family transcriptional regulator [Sneathiella marina]USG61058.1 FadR family transcriptional regulator [Sneathiella marina]